MHVSDALSKRRSTRAFLDTPIETARLTRLIAQASRAPSGGNLQPWHVHLLNGAAMTRFHATMAPRLDAGQTDPLEYPIYPPSLSEPYRTRRFAVGEQMYARLGIPRTDKAKRLEWFHRNWRFFDAPAGLFLFTDRMMGAAQWSDLGGFLQTLMLLLVEDGLASCPQEAWAMHHTAVTDFCDTPPDLMLFCGLAIGIPDPAHPLATFETERAPQTEWLTLHE
ncbi:Nitroreductase [Monaibacterium marinum]|uniref:Nitroreductase n=1 Tax=Pontivivens marinum TaxID=1690039 RepID=A0A2C9CQ21_9RHOB|nr:nitroreductase [Monaibacterium marinum]SOH93307.1 Nitroreductase [Monaibacterium marinum]